MVAYTINEIRELGDPTAPVKLRSSIWHLLVFDAAAVERRALHDLFVFLAERSPLRTDFIVAQLRRLQGEFHLLGKVGVAAGHGKLHRQRLLTSQRHRMKFPSQIRLR
jgi:hypothetical protein